MSARHGLGTRLRHLLELLDGDVAEVYREAGHDYSPRYTPVIRALRDRGASSISALAQHAGLTHSALSQTVAEMKRMKLVRVTRGRDARVRQVVMSADAQRLLPMLEVQWAATDAAAEALDKELTASLRGLVEEAISALELRPFRTRIKAQVRRAESAAPGGPNVVPTHDAGRLELDGDIGRGSGTR
jgi:DNA-binding MarR family transcriptional regulator